ncbi:hypothetical protein BIT28_19430 [Photobacterium proteolyticum]|uniref:Spermidine synthase n=1 Tax=Photobacterium proteolyticum TaxID=1903952 RepID=A0A1Q9GHW0_9GAMM|nr:MFS transporter [Photobacterium proteolyticum]OLQ74059.1 hypothetical protein BIT28_19430 [Photobacterium proteolyticum]
MSLSAVFLVSLSSLAFEVLLARIFSISQWNHLSFMVISIALFGFAASGTALSIFDSRKNNWTRQFATGKVTPFLVLLYSCSTLVSFMLLIQLPLDYFRLPLESIQAFYLFLSYTLLAIPFFFAGVIVLSAYVEQPENTGFIYFSTMAGSALGTILPSLLLPFIGEGKLAVTVAIVPLCYVTAAALIKNKKIDGSRYPPRNLSLSLVSTCIMLLIIPLLFTPWGAQLTVTPSPYKSLSQLLQFPQSTVTESTSSITGKIDTVTSPYIRYAPGLSLKYSGNLPVQSAIFRDGDEQLVLYGANGNSKTFEFARFTLPSVGYDFVPLPQSALLVIRGGGTSIPTALAAGIPDITIIHESPSISRAIAEHYNLRTTSENPRIFFRHSQRKYDIIHIESWGTSLAGSAALSQEYLFTTEAFEEYLNHLSEKGVIIVSRKLLLPPSDSIRLFSTALQVLRESDKKDPLHHLVLLRNWGIFTLVVSKNPIENIKTPMDFAERLNFDIVYIRDMQSSLANRFNSFELPHHYLAIDNLLQHYREKRDKQFFDDYLLDAAPQDDNRPFPGRFIKWDRLGDLYQSMGSRPYSMLLSGEVVIAVVFIEALAVSALLLLLPQLFAKGKQRKIPLSQKLYFFSIGAGFMFVEIYFIKAYIQIFSSPVLSFTFVLAGILLSSGIGGWWSQKMGRNTVTYSLSALCLTLIGILYFMDLIIDHLLGLPMLLRYLFAQLILFPPGVIMGIPFTLGMRCLLTTPLQRAYAWAMNGCASVLTSIVAAGLALNFGFQSIMLCATVFYLLAVFCSRDSEADQADSFP